MTSAVLRIEAWDARSSWMNETAMEGLMVLICWIMGAILDSVRPRRRIVEGEPWLSDKAVSAPMDLMLGPVMRTVCSC